MVYSIVISFFLESRNGVNVILHTSFSATTVLPSFKSATNVGTKPKYVGLGKRD